MPIFGKDGASKGKNILLVGTESRGKSSTGNTILDLNLFEVSDSSQFMNDIKMHSRMIENVNVTIVDALTLPDETNLSNKSKKITQDNLKTCFEVCKDGFDFVVLVLRHDSQVTELECTLTEIFRKNFDEWPERHALIFTHGETFEMMAKVPFAEWCKGATGRLRRLIDNCKNKPLLFHKHQNLNTDSRIGLLRTLNGISAKKRLSLRNLPEPLFGISTEDQKRRKTSEDDLSQRAREASEHSSSASMPFLTDQSGNGKGVTKKRNPADHTVKDELKNRVISLKIQLDDLLSGRGNTSYVLQEANALRKEIDIRKYPLNKLDTITCDIIKLTDDAALAKTKGSTEKAGTLRLDLQNARDQLEKFPLG